ncbi:MAG: sugar phosphate isomerase/epimerase [Planctomycetota bacterium]|nr:sugar phosphate isomerase/epimerase [Planctomycetota bacterium]
MKKSISYWSFKDGLAGTHDPAAAFREAKEKGFDAVEVCVGTSGAFDIAKLDQSACAGIRKLAEEAGVEISSAATGFYWGCSLTANSAGTRKKAVEFTKRMIQVASWLGTDAVLVVPGAVDVFFDPKSEKIRYDEVYKRSKASLKACLKTAEKCGVSMCVENVWNKFLLSPLEMRDFVDSFGSPRVKAYFDVGNVILTGFPQHWIEILGRRIGRIHAKGFKFAFFGGGESGDIAPIAEACRKLARGTGWCGAYAFCDLDAGDLDWPAILAALKKAKYDKYITAEMLPWDPTVIERTSRQFDAILGKK